MLTFLLLAQIVWVGTPQTPEQAAEILRNLKSPVNKTDYQYVIPRFTMPRLGSRSLPRLRRQPLVSRKATAVPAIPRRLDGTRKDSPPIVYGFTPHDWQWWYQWEVHREAR